jgi:general secretion pathway protein M
MALAPMSPSQSRQMALGLLAAAILAVVAAIALPVWLLSRHYDAALEDTTSRLDRYRRIAGTRPAVAKQLEAIRAKESRKFFLRGGAPSLSAAEAQEAVRSIVEANGGRLITMQAPTVREESGGRYRQISVNVQLTANIFALRKILGAVENNTPYLFVDNLMVRSQVPGNFKPGPGAEPEVFVQFEVSGFAQTGT